MTLQTTLAQDAQLTNALNGTGYALFSTLQAMLVESYLLGAGEKGTTVKVETSSALDRALTRTLNGPALNLLTALQGLLVDARLRGKSERARMSEGLPLNDQVKAGRP